MDERHKFIDNCHKHYSTEIAALFEKDLWQASGRETIDKTIAFLLALENVKISTIESLGAIGTPRNRVNKLLKNYALSKNSAIKKNKGRIEKMMSKQKSNIFTQLEKDKQNMMYR